MNQTIKYVFIWVFLSFSFMSRAQLDSCNVFLKGNHVEVGINPLGAYGSVVNTPPGYHPQGSFWVGSNSGACVLSSGGLNLGFVADPFLTGWTNYYGDYYLPGSPQEGWAIQINGHHVHAYTAVDLAAPVGANIAYNVSGSRISGTWQGMIDSVQITQVTSLDTGDLFFRVDVTFTNLSVFPKDSVVYLRTLDPDCDQTLWGSFTTKNVVEHQVTTSSNLVVVSAAGTTDTNAYLALGTNDARAKCFIMDFGLTPSFSPNTIYYNLCSYYYTGVSTSDQGIGLAVNIGHLATVDSAADSITLQKSTALHPANSSSISYAYAFKRQIIDTVNFDNIGSIGPNSINKISDKTQLKVSPNPVRGIATVSGLSAGEQVSIYDLTGREVLRNIAGSDDKLNINVEHLSRGMYLLIVKDTDGVIRNRVKIEKE